MKIKVTVQRDGRPDNVCQKCGYHKSYCCCKIQGKFTQKQVFVPVTYPITEDVLM